MPPGKKFFFNALLQVERLSYIHLVYRVTDFVNNTFERCFYNSVKKKHFQSYWNVLYFLL